MYKDSCVHKDQRPHVTDLTILPLHRQHPQPCLHHCLVSLALHSCTCSISDSMDTQAISGWRSHCLFSQISIHCHLIAATSLPYTDTSWSPWVLATLPPLPKTSITTYVCMHRYMYSDFTMTSFHSPFSLTYTHTHSPHSLPVSMTFTFDIYKDPQTQTSLP